MKLKIRWQERLRLRAEGDKLRAEGDKLWAEGDRLRAESDRLRAEGDKLWAEGNKLRAEGDKMWAEGVIEIYGDIILEWKRRGDVLDCHLENGDVYRGDDPLE